MTDTDPIIDPQPCDGRHSSGTSGVAARLRIGLATVEEDLKGIEQGALTNVVSSDNGSEILDLNYCGFEVASEVLNSEFLSGHYRAASAAM